MREPLAGHRRRVLCFLPPEDLAEQESHRDYTSQPETTVNFTDVSSISKKVLFWSIYEKRSCKYRSIRFSYLSRARIKVRYAQGKKKEEREIEREKERFFRTGQRNKFLWCREEEKRREMKERREKKGEGGDVGTYLKG